MAIARLSSAITVISCKGTDISAFTSSIPSRVRRSVSASAASAVASLRTARAGRATAAGARMNFSYSDSRKSGNNTYAAKYIFIAKGASFVATI